MEEKRATSANVIRMARRFPSTITDNPNVSREECVDFLRKMGPMSDELLKLLNLPDRLIFSQGESFRAFSVPGGTGLQRLASSFALGQPVPRDFPDYAIHIGSVGNNFFCTFVDRWRKIIVYGSIRNAQAGEGSWETFLLDLKGALNSVEKQDSKGEKFDFVICKNGAMKIL